MPRDALGAVTLSKPAFTPSTLAKSADVNNVLSDLAAVAGDSLSRSGKGGMQAALDMGGYRQTNLGAATAGSDAVRLDQSRAPTGDAPNVQGDSSASIVATAATTGANAGVGFHVPGQYATKIMLRADGYLIFGGWSAAPSRFYVNMTNGDASCAGSFYASVNLTVGGSATVGADLGVGGKVTSGSIVTVNGGTSGNQLRLKSGAGTTGYGVLLRNDGTNFYLLATAGNDADGTFSALRPFSFNLASGAVAFGHTVSVPEGVWLQSTGGATRNRILPAANGDTVINGDSSQPVQFAYGGVVKAWVASDGSYRTAVGAAYQNDGNIYMPWAGAYLSTVVANLNASISGLFSTGFANNGRWERNNATGVIRQWLKWVTGSDGHSRLVWPVAFPSVCETVHVTGQGFSMTFWYTNEDTGGVDVYATSAGAYNFSIQAVGR